MPENMQLISERLAARDIPQSLYLFMIDKIESFVKDQNPDFSSDEIADAVYNEKEDFFESTFMMTGEKQRREAEAAKNEKRSPDFIDHVRYDQFEIGRAKLGVEDRAMLNAFIERYYKGGSVEELFDVQTRYENFKEALSNEFENVREEFLNENKSAINNSIKLHLQIKQTEKYVSPTQEQSCEILKGDVTGVFSDVDEKIAKVFSLDINLKHNRDETDEEYDQIEKERFTFRSIFESIRQDVLFAEKVQLDNGKEYWKHENKQSEKAKVFQGVIEQQAMEGEIEPSAFFPKAQVQVNSEGITVSHTKVEDGTYTSIHTKKSYTVSNDRLFEDWKVAYGAKPKNNKAAEQGYKTPDAIPYIVQDSQLADTYKETPLVKQASFSEAAMDPANDSEVKLPEGKKYDGMTQEVRKINSEPKYKAVKMILNVLDNETLSDEDKVSQITGMLDSEDMSKVDGVSELRKLYTAEDIPAQEKIAQLRGCVVPINDERERRICAARVSMGQITSRIAQFFKSCCDGTSALSRTYRAGMLHPLYNPVIRDRRTEEQKEREKVKWDQKPMIFTGINALLLFQDSYDRHDAFLFDPRYITSDDIAAIQRMKEETSKLGYPSGETIALKVDVSHRPAMTFVAKQTPVYEKLVKRNGKVYLDANGNESYAQSKAKGYNIFPMYNASMLEGIPKYHHYRHQAVTKNENGEVTGITTEAPLSLKALERMNKVMLTVAYEMGLVNRSKENDGSYRPWLELTNSAFKKHPNGVALTPKHANFDELKIQMPSPKQAPGLYVTYSPEKGGIRTIPNASFCALFIRRLVERADALNEWRIEDRNTKYKSDRTTLKEQAAEQSEKDQIPIQPKVKSIYGVTHGPVAPVLMDTARERMDEPLKAIRIELATFLVCQMLSFPYAPNISQKDRDAGINEKNYLAKLCQSLIAHSVDYGQYKLSFEQRTKISRGELEPDIEWACAVDEALNNFQKNLDKAAQIQEMIVPKHMYHELGLTGREMPLLNTADGLFFAYTQSDLKDFSQNVNESSLREVKTHIALMKQEADERKGSFYTNLACSLEDEAFKKLIEEPVMESVAKQLKAEREKGTLTEEQVQENSEAISQFIEAARKVTPERCQPGVSYTGIVTNIDDIANTFTMLVTKTDSSRMGVDLGVNEENKFATPIAPLSLTEETAKRVTSPDKPHFVDFHVPARYFRQDRKTGIVKCRPNENMEVIPGAAWKATQTKIGVNLARPDFADGKTVSTKGNILDVVQHGRRSVAPER